MNTAVRCFRRLVKGEKRRGVWIYTQPDGPNLRRGLFFHGTRNETQPPVYTITIMESDNEFCEEITPEEALQELSNWPEGQAVMQNTFDRHPKV